MQSLFWLSKKWATAYNSLKSAVFYKQLMKKSKFMTYFEMTVALDVKIAIKILFSYSESQSNSLSTMVNQIFDILKPGSVQCVKTVKIIFSTLARHY